MSRYLVLTLIIIIFMTNSCTSQHKKQPNKNDRLPAVAGQFYAKDSTTLTHDLKKLFYKAVPRKYKDILALIVPHAGYVFSGEVAASGFNQLEPEKEYENIFIIGSSHRSYFDAASVYCEGNFITPLGIVEVDTALANKLITEYGVFKNYKDAHWFEHSLEVELPFLQYHLKKPFKIVPIILGTNDVSTCKKIASALEPYFNNKNLFVISTDFSHYPNYNDALKIDNLTAAAIEKNNAQTLQDVLKSNEKLKIPNLSTSLCGWSSVLSLLYITEKKPGISITTIQYQNSGNNPDYGDSSRVVGYTAMAVAGNIEKNKDDFSLTETDKKQLLLVARNTLNEYIQKGKTPEINTENFSPVIKQNCGAFVTLHKNGKLRGCIGQFTAQKPLYLIIQDMAKAASTEDYRFEKVTSDELQSIDIEISVLSPLKLIKSIDEIELGKHGIYIMKGNRGGTFLPQVATETGWSKEEFLGHCAQDKAGIGWNGWKDAEIFIYTAIVFGEKDIK